VRTRRGRREPCRWSGRDGIADRRRWRHARTC
jgi:hypothetical protein